ncbi:hypothetical protein BpHYR1_007546 [Brachionus plicatilis]|uniref:Uncharacterized protein n=1 Tax=Brachionus plicatilis TaxID=10195 RepID=A0A3M7S1I6_BRAPC|nr:hypothetical protein BpHYR1_007546 [Brachionus plicatilis]
MYGLAKLILFFESEGVIQNFFDRLLKQVLCSYLISIFQKEDLIFIRNCFDCIDLLGLMIFQIFFQQNKEPSFVDRSTQYAQTNEELFFI